MEAESRQWIVRCRKHRHETSIWELGGMRYKARGRKVSLLKCPTCQRYRWCDVFRRQDDE